MTEIKDESMTFSGSDKLSWGFVIQRKMAQCIDKEGTDDYSSYVKQLYDCVNTNFYGLDFQKPIERFLDELNKAKDIKVKKFLTSLHYKPISLEETSMFDRVPFEMDLTTWYWYNIFCCIRDIFAENRGLFFGSDDLKFSQQMKDSD